ncbi:MAG: DHA2 family efflux MFS transporter permease subunit [Dehalococcoidia bacterium]|nr:DHA2 family efflux MFS transporter permease subunit [Dehalococcoidia bacterium]
MNRSAEYKILIVSVLGTFMVILDQTIMNIALPHIMAVFNETADRAQLVISAYLMATAITTPAAAYLCDRFGIKKVYLLSQVGFLVGSVLCGLAWNTNTLVFFRVLQGLAGGLLSPIAMTMLFLNVPPEDRGTMMAIFGIPMMLAPAIGPVLGGYLVTYWDWRMCFYVNVPVVLLAIAIGMIWIADSPLKKSTFDIKGFMLAAIGFSSILYAFSYAPSWHWDDWRIVTMLVVGSACILTWILVELREKQPMLDLHIFKYGGFSLATGLNFVVTIGLFSVIFLLPLFLQNIRGLNAMQTGLMLMPMVLGSMITMPIGGRLYDTIGPRVPAVIGIVLTAVSSFWLQMLDVTTPDSILLLILFIRSMGMGFCMMPIMTYAMSAVPLNMTAQASSITNVSRTIFASLGVAVFATMLDQFQKTNAAVMAQTLTPDSSIAMQFLSTVQVMMMQAGQTMEAARMMGISLLSQYVNLRAIVAAYELDYVISALIITLGIIPAMFLPFGRAKKVEAPADVGV